MWLHDQVIAKECNTIHKRLHTVTIPYSADICVIWRPFFVLLEVDTFML